MVLLELFSLSRGVSFSISFSTTWNLHGIYISHSNAKKIFWGGIEGSGNCYKLTIILNASGNTGEIYVLDSGR